MAASVNIPGPCEVLVDTGASHALETLGWTVGGAQIDQRDYFHEVKGDQNGGEEGEPIERQRLGHTHSVTLEFSKYDEAVMSKIQNGIYGGIEGTSGTIGLPMYSNAFRLLLKPALGGAIQTVHVRNYARAIPEGPAHICGTKATQKRMKFMCHSTDTGGVGGVAGCYNKTTT